MRSVGKIVKHIICYLSYYFNVNDYTLQMDVYDFVQELKHRSSNSSKSDPAELISTTYFTATTA